MQHSINLKVEKFNEKAKDYCVATSLDVLWLIVEVENVLEIAGDPVS
jgi:hypothetical protein